MLGFPTSWLSPKNKVIIYIPCVYTCKMLVNYLLPSVRANWRRIGESKYKRVLAGKSVRSWIRLLEGGQDLSRAGNVSESPGVLKSGFSLTLSHTDIHSNRVEGYMFFKKISPVTLMCVLCSLSPTQVRTTTLDFFCFGLSSADRIQQAQTGANVLLHVRS